jgi:hypothetical protein
MFLKILHTCAFNDEINFEKFKKVVKSLKFIGILLIGFFSPNGSIVKDLTIETGLCHPANSPPFPSSTHSGQRGSQKQKALLFGRKQMWNFA